jgi:DNA mismatch repair ATPase MutS
MVLLAEDRATYLVALVGDGDGAGELGLAWTDVAAGEFKAGEFALEYAAADPRFTQPLDNLRLEDLEAWLARECVFRGK